jgi:hypothetical protein
VYHTHSPKPKSKIKEKSKTKTKDLNKTAGEATTPARVRIGSNNRVHAELAHIGIPARNHDVRVAL